MKIALCRADQNSRWVQIVVLAGAVLVSALLSIAPARAHDRLLEAEPADGSSVKSAEFSALTLKFSAEPLKLGNHVVVTDADGTVVFDGEPRVDGTAVVAELMEPPSPGKLVARWRVVSSDGHPIAGEYSVNVVGPVKNGPESPRGDSSSASDQGGATDTLRTQDAASAQRQKQERTSDAALWLPVVGIGVLVLVVGAFVVIRKDSE